MNVFGWQIFRKRQPAETSPLDGVLPRVRSMREHTDWPSSTTPATQQQRRDRVANARRRVLYRPLPRGTQQTAESTQNRDGWFGVALWYGMALPWLLALGFVMVQRINDWMDDPSSDASQIIMNLSPIMGMVGGACLVTALAVYWIKSVRRRR